MVKVNSFFIKQLHLYYLKNRKAVLYLLVAQKVIKRQNDILFNIY